MIKTIKSDEEFKIAPTRHILLDLDCTLLLCNSTLKFYETLRPALWLRLLHGLFFFLRPFKFFKGPNQGFIYADDLRFRLTCLLFPGALRHWQSLAPAVAARYWNTQLQDSLPPDCVPVVVTYGYEALVRPLLEASPLKSYELVCCTPEDYYQYRAQGKAQRIRERYGLEFLKHSTYITDSEDDRDILDQVQTPILVRWQTAEEPGPAQQAYYPGFFTHEVKYHGSRYIFKYLLADQFLVLALGWAIWSLGLFEALAFILLFFSWFCIHELGYYHNEYNSSEENPRHLNPHVKKYKAYKMLPEALIWSGSSAALALWLLPASYLKPGLWLVFLGLHALVFRWHNGLAPHKRYFSFLSLHSLRYFWPWIFFSLSPAGAALIVAQILRYLLLYYRQKSGRNAVNKYFSDHFWMLCLYLFFIWVLELLIPNTEFIKESIWFIGLTSLFLLLRALYQQYAIYQSKARES